MVVKRLVDAVVFGFGASAGKKLFDEALEKAEQPEPTEEERRAEQAKAEATARAESDRRASEAKRALAAAEEAKAKREAEIDDELAAQARQVIEFGGFGSLRALRPQAPNRGQS